MKNEMGCHAPATPLAVWSAKAYTQSKDAEIVMKPSAISNNTVNLRHLPQGKSIYMEWCEVIGNIHDNPELLQEV